MEDWLRLTAAGLARAVRERSIGVEELTRAYLERIEAYGGPKGLNAVMELNKRAIEEARRLDGEKERDGKALFGLPILIKDNIDAAGLHTTAGSPALADNLAETDAPVVVNLRKSGALILGKTKMTEFANYVSTNMPAGYSALGGQVKNAYDREKSPSGSSSGSAVAVSARLCAAAVGTDTSFSVVGCAAENGVTGLKPAHGELASGGIIPIAHTLDSAGPLTVDFTDALLVYSAMRGEPLGTVEAAESRRLRLAVNTFNREQVSDAQMGLYGALFEGLRKDGACVSEVTHPHTTSMGEIMRCEFRHDLEEYLAHSTAKRRTLREIVDCYEANPETMKRYGNAHLLGALEKASGKLSDEDYLAALEERRQLRTSMLESLRNYDACVMTGPTSIMHFTGLPSLALRLGMGADGTPCGVILYGADERRLFSAALTVERYCKPVPPPEL